MLLHLLASLVIGALSGAIANKIMNGNPKGFFQNALLGIEVNPLPVLTVLRAVHP